jgi:hypothetical protein
MEEHSQQQCHCSLLHRVLYKPKSQSCPQAIIMALPLDIRGIFRTAGMLTNSRFFHTHILLGSIEPLTVVRP